MVYWVSDWSLDKIYLTLFKTAIGSTTILLESFTVYHYVRHLNETLRYIQNGINSSFSICY